MYRLECPFYKKEFRSLDDLLQDVLESGMDPNYEIYKDDQPTGQMVTDFINP